VDLDTKKRTRLTDDKDPAPQLTGVTKEILKYERADKVPLSGTLYLPPGYKAGTRVPCFVWAYPLEYSDADTAGQVRLSPNSFTRLTGASPLFFLTQGWAVLMDATMPVVGDPEHMNDTYVEQIAASAKATIDALDARGVVDRKRVVVGGHSYGAFMTANLLAHTDLFAAGIARSGAYNRSLTPFGFQSERRNYWEATDVYTKVSPFTYANRIKAPLLLIHGEADNNSGTFPIQSERLFAAIQGTGGTARLVILPSEAHGYRARESVLHTLAEMLAWGEKWTASGTAASAGGAAR
jgi:dipeptidyl aminopeptidase/acylaminoacyl peptidase